ncbi:hypothetical protein PPTG_07959 [Phytophthora nicotianae INRA-310]|nr:hypothetical protein PPTG_07959 [Phytophthora nicotianae INRA-310]ETN14338.1 hypothetical protein PPTG_07959 [Phytophthora nicotianae INRA-310]
MFEKWHKDKRTSRLVTRLIKSDPAIEKKYRAVYKLYAEYLKMIYRKENTVKRLAANNRR